MFKTGSQMMLLVLLTGLFLISESRRLPIRLGDEAFADLLGELSAKLPQPAAAKAAQAAPVALISIGESSLASHPWPWTPLDYSLFVQAILPFHPEVVAIDEILDWERASLSPGDRQKLPQYEKILREALLRCPKLLLGARLGWPEDPQAIPPLQEAPLLKKVSGDLREIPEWTAIEHQPKEDYRLSATLGFLNPPPGERWINRAPLVLRYRGQVVPTFALQAVLLWQRLSPDDVTVVLGSHIAAGEKLRIPINDRGEMRVNFHAPLTQIGFDDLLLANEQVAARQKATAPVERIAGAIALLARTEPKARTLPFPLGRRGATGELSAAAIATIQSQTFIRRVPHWFDFAFVGSVALLAYWIPEWKRRTASYIALGLFAAYSLGAAALYYFQRMTLPAALPIGLLLFLVLYRLATPHWAWRPRRPVIF
jgi:hypothetical protein